MQDGENFFLIGECVTPEGYDANRIEVENSDREPPPGEHVFLCVGIVGEPKQQQVNVFVDKYSAHFFAMNIGVKFVLESDPGASVTDYFTLPPLDPSQHRAYFRGSDKQDGLRPGNQANKFVHFIERLGFPWPAGSPMPIEARNPNNWKGRRIIATSRPSYQKITTNSQTGLEETKLVRANFKWFSYRSAYDANGQPIQLQGTVTQHPPQAPKPATAGGPYARTAPPPPVPVPVPAPQQGFSEFGGTEGLDDV